MAPGLKSNPIQFAVVREDPHIEIQLFEQFNLHRALLVASGGCTAFALGSRFPDVRLTLVDPNPAQIGFVKAKLRMLQSGKKSLRKEFGVGAEVGLIELGNFESLFRRFREFVFEFVVPRPEMARLLVSGQSWTPVFRHPYWPVAFDLHFSTSLLLAMFGPAAIQHAPKESYARYFQSVMEKGLSRRDCRHNYFLHHIFLGHYLSSRAAWPFYLQKPPQNLELDFVNGLVQDVRDFGAYDFIGLSNIFDWSSAAEVRRIAGRISAEARPGTMVLFRQLNNKKKFNSFFGRQFRWHIELGRRFQKSDRSLFYSSVHIGEKR